MLHIECVVIATKCCPIFIRFMRLNKKFGSGFVVFPLTHARTHTPIHTHTLHGIIKVSRWQRHVPLGADTVSCCRGWGVRGNDYCPVMCFNSFASVCFVSFYKLYRYTVYLHGCRYTTVVLLAWWYEVASFFFNTLAARYWCSSRRSVLFRITTSFRHVPISFLVTFTPRWYDCEFKVIKMWCFNSCVGAGCCI